MSAWQWLRKATTSLPKEWYNNNFVPEMGRGRKSGVLMHDTSSFFEFCFVQSWKHASKTDMYACKFNKSHSLAGFEIFGPSKVCLIHSRLYFNYRIEFFIHDTEQYHHDSVTGALSVCSS